MLMFGRYNVNHVPYVKCVSALTFSDQHATQSTAEAEGSGISLAGVLS